MFVIILMMLVISVLAVSYRMFAEVKYTQSDNSVLIRYTDDGIKKVNILKFKTKGLAKTKLHQYPRNEHLNLI